VHPWPRRTLREGHGSRDWGARIGAHFSQNGTTPVRSSSISSEKRFDIFSNLKSKLHSEILPAHSFPAAIFTAISPEEFLVGRSRIGVCLAVVSFVAAACRGCGGGSAALQLPAPPRTSPTVSVTQGAGSTGTNISVMTENGFAGSVQMRLPNPEERMAKAALAVRIAGIIRTRKLTQARAARILKSGSAKKFIVFSAGGCPVLRVTVLCNS